MSNKKDLYCTLCGAQGHMAKDCKWLRVKNIFKYLLTKNKH